MTSEHPPSRKGNRLCEPPGRCIYCDSTSALTNEHVIAQGLGWTEFIPDASCAACRKITGEMNGFEGVVQRGMFRPLRVRMGLRNKKRPLAKEIEATVHDANGRLVLAKIPPNDLPMRAIFPELAWPGMLRTDGLDDTEMGDIQAHIIGDVSAVPRLFQHGYKSNSLTLHIGAFARMLAKIGHCQTVAEIGIDGFDPFLREVIAGTNIEVWPRYIGCDINAMPPPERDVLHWIKWGAWELNGEYLFLVNIRLFANIGGPVYEVITGRIRGGQKVTPEAE